MQSNEKIEYIKQKLQERDIDENTQNYIVRYVQMNEKLYGSVIDIDQLVKRLVDNMQYSITTKIEGYDALLQTTLMLSTSGNWDAYKRKIFVSPFYKFGAMISKRFILSKDSTLFHELDNCGTTVYVDMTEQEKDEYIKNYIKTNGIKSIPDQNEFRRVINQTYEMSDGKKAIVGIKDADVKDDIALNLAQLNEGITAYKQEMFDKYNGVKHRSQYKAQKDVARLIADVIGEDNMIRLQFGNNYNGIREMFNRKTGKDLNEIVKMLNKIKATELMFAGRLGDVVFSVMLKKYMKDAEIKIDDEKENTTIQETKAIEQVGVGLNEINQATSEMRKDLTLTREQLVEKD